MPKIFPNFTGTGRRLPHCLLTAGVGNVLTKSEEYRAKADECEWLAAQTSDPDIKRQLLDIARQWRAMANNSEQHRR